MIPPAEIIKRIDDYTLATEDQEKRTYLGASVIGEKCVRKLFYDFRWVGQERFSARMLRLFSRGDREEAQFISLLRGAGFVVEASDEHTKDDRADFQFSDCSGHFKGTSDAALLPPDTDVWVLGEFKGLKDDQFKELKRRGVKEHYPKYFSQMQTYMGQLGLPRALFCAVNKQDDDLYFEWVEFDQDEFNTCCTKAQIVINSIDPPERISNNPDTFTCRYCPHNKLCHENAPIAPENRHCRNCSFSSPDKDGSWKCNADQTFGTLCPSYQPVCGSSDS